jgi:hypothetical protein
VPDLVPVQAALADVADRERAGRPDVAGVGLAVGLQDGHAPLGGAEFDRPVQRGGAAIAERARVDDQAAVPRPDRLRDELLQEGTDDELWLVLGDGCLHRVGRVDHGDLHLVPQLGERDPRSLAEAVVGRDQEENAHGEEEARARDYIL